LVFLALDIVAVIYIIAAKVVTMTTCHVKGTTHGSECRDNNIQFPTKEAYTTAVTELRSWGFHLQDEVDEPKTNRYAFGFNPVASLKYEGLLLVWYLTCASFYLMMRRTIRRLQK
jgi:hypothetical protein